VLAVSPILLTAVILGVFAKFITIPFPKGIGSSPNSAGSFISQGQLL
jgi:hypothetical protein